METGILFEEPLVFWRVQPGDQRAARVVVNGPAEVRIRRRRTRLDQTRMSNELATQRLSVSPFGVRPNGAG
jgi:hypothetical protein